ncbi:hypothetical protein FQN54_007888 [Arachnomyces sp. PD_36]|nr:hypothetical protein FQN54_007888 [Arachnomyces sp. PD_36]
MTDEEDKARAEKLAAAKKKVAQAQKKKQKAKSKKSEGAAGSSKAAATAEEPAEEGKPEEEKKEEGDDSAEKQKGDVAEEPAESAAEPASEPAVEASPESEVPPETATGTTHGRQPSLSVQSKMRSSSFRRSSISQSGNSQAAASHIKSPPLPPLTPDGETMPELFRKQAARLEELEKENKRLEKDMQDVEGRWKKSTEELDDLREANGEVVELKDRMERAEKKAAEVEKLKSEIASLQRQNTQLHTKAHRGSNSVSVSGASDSSPAALLSQIDSKTATIESMELEISNLRAQANSQSTSSTAHETQISALEDKLARSERSLEQTQRELADTKHSLTRASEKAVKEGVDKTSSETLVKSLERQVEELNNAKAEAEKKIENLEKKLQALGNLHKESESRNQARLRESEKIESEAAVLRKKLATTENENLRLREERERARKRDVGHTGDEEGLDELEDEERARLERRVRELEGEVFDLTRGVYKEKRQELGAGAGAGPESAHSDLARSPGGEVNNFDDVDLIGGAPGEHSRRRSMAAAAKSRHQQQQQHSSFSTVLSSGLAALTGAGGDSRQQYHPAAPGPKQGRGSLDFLSEEVESLDDDDDEFDAEAFAQAQAEEEARKRVEWVREVKRKLKDWEGWRLDLVDSRAGAEGVLGVGLGEIFEV